MPEVTPTISYNGTTSIDATKTNYATPVDDCASIFTRIPIDTQTKYANCATMVLDGTYHPISGDIGWWNNQLSGADGVLADPIIIDAIDVTTLQAIRLVGDSQEDIYPTHFTAVATKNDIIVYQLNVEDNTEVIYIKYLDNTLLVDKIRITITAVNRANVQCRLTNVFQPHDTHRKSELNLGIAATSEITTFKYIGSTVALNLYRSSKIYTTNTFERSRELTLQGQLSSIPTNVHTRMSDAVRGTYGKLYVTYSNPLADTLIQSESSGVAYNSSITQAYNGKTNKNGLKCFTLYENDLSGNYVITNDQSEVGWRSTAVSNIDRAFDTTVFFTNNFTARLIVSFKIIGDIKNSVYATDFTIRATRPDNTYVEWTVNDYNSVEYSYSEKLADIVQIKVTILKVNKVGYPAIITELTTNATLLYEQDQLVSMDLLEELSYDDTIGVLGSISANEITVYISNETQDFYFNNESALLSKQLKRNRRLAPFLGTEIIPNQIEWYPLGIFWSYSWDVPVGKLVAKVIAFDSIGLLNTFTFSDHTVFFNKTLAELCEIVLLSAKQTFKELVYEIDSSLASVIIPIAWFEKASYMQALKKLAGGALIDIYCDRYGKIIVRRQRAIPDKTVSTWTDNTNVSTKSYPTLYTEVPNRINVAVTDVTQAVQNVLSYTTLISVSEGLQQEFVFSYPVIGDLVITVVKDETVTYSYDYKSWGIIFTFYGTGTVSSITINANSLAITNTATMTSQDLDAITLNGENVVNIQNNFIQSTERAKFLADTILAIALEELYTTDVKYRGDIALSLNDAIVMTNGIAPIDKYLITRHTLSWNGALKGTARLTT